MAVKVTFTLDEETVARLGQTARRLARPKSAVVREAIREYHARADRLSEAERRRMLAIVRRMRARPPERGLAAMKRELAEIRAIRRHGGRLHPVE